MDSEKAVKNYQIALKKVLIAQEGMDKLQAELSTAIELVKKANEENDQKVREWVYTDSTDIDGDHISETAFFTDEEAIVANKEEVAEGSIYWWQLAKAETANEVKS